MRVPSLPFFALRRSAAGHTSRRASPPWFLILALLLTVSPAAATRAAPSDAAPAAPPLPTASAPSSPVSFAALSTGGLPLKPYLFVLPDPAGTLTPDEAARIPLRVGENSLSRPAGGGGAPDAPTFTPWTPSLGDRPAGSLWLRFTLSPDGSADNGQDTAGTASAHGVPVQAPGQRDPLLLDLGDQTPGVPRVWIIPARGSTGAEAGPEQTVSSEAPLYEVRRDRAGFHPLPPLREESDVLIRLDGLPGLWFTPMLRTLPDAMNAPERRLHPLALAALTSLLLLCVVRSVMERGEGRIWAAVFAGVGLLHALGGVPATPSGAVAVADMPGVLAAGIALMILPHLGRSIMHTRELAPVADVALLILALPGAVLALLPLLPGQAWVARLLALWPMGSALCLLPTLPLMLWGTPGSAVFFLACLSMTAASAGALWGAASSAAPLWGMAPLGGIILAVLLLAAAPRAAYRTEPAFSPRKSGNGRRRASPSGKLDRPHRTVRDLSEPVMPLPAGETTERDDSRMEDARLVRLAVRMEEALRSPLDALLREACSLDQVLAPDRLNPSLAETGVSLPDTARLARAHADNMVAASRELSALITDIPRTALHAGHPPVARVAFDVRRLVRDAFDAVHEQAEKKGVGLSWYLAPHMGLLYRGDRDRLRFILSLLLEDAVRATDHGVVSLRVRRGASSVNPGHLRFSVADTGEGSPPLRRSSLMLARAWELAASHHGELTVQGSPGGVEISFSLECEALTEDGTAVIPCPPPAATTADRQEKQAERRAEVVIVASNIPLNRQLLAFYLRSSGRDNEQGRQGGTRPAESDVSSGGRPIPVREVWEARSAGEAVALYSHTPAGLVVLDGRLPEDDMVAAVAAIRVMEGERSLPAVAFLAIATDEAQAQRLRQAGCDQTLLFPASGGELRLAARNLAGRDIPPRSAVLRRTPPSTFRSGAPLPEGRTNASAESPATPAPAFIPITLSESPASGATAARTDASEPAPVVPEQAEAAEKPRAVPHAGPTWATAPKKRFQWLSSLLKPTPRIRQEEPTDEDAAQSSTGRGDEWVGEPTPITVPAKPIRTTAEASTEKGPKEGENTHGSVSDAETDANGSPLSSPERESHDEQAAFEPSPLPAEKDAEGDHTVRVAAMTFVLPDPESPASDLSVPDLPELPDPGDTPDASTAAPPIPKVVPPQADASPAAGENAPEHAESATPPITSETPSSSSASQNDNERIDLTPDPEAATGLPGEAPSEERPVEPPRQHPSRSPRRKSRLEDIPFLSLDPNYTPPESLSAAPEPEPKEGGQKEASPRAGADAVDPGVPAETALPLSVHEETIVELTEADMLDSPLLRQVPDLVHSLDAALEQARKALEEHDAGGVAKAAGRMAERAGAFGLHGMSDLALCLKQAAGEEDFDAIAQLIPDVEAEVDLHRGRDLRSY